MRFPSSFLKCLLIENLLQPFQSSGHPAFDRPLRYTQYLGDLLEFKPLEMFQDQDLSLLDWKHLKRPFDPRASLSFEQRLIGRSRSIGEVQRLLAQRAKNPEPSPLLTIFVNGQVGRYAEYPVPRLKVDGTWRFPSEKLLHILIRGGQGKVSRTGILDPPEEAEAQHEEEPV